MFVILLNFFLSESELVRIEVLREVLVIIKFRREEQKTMRMVDSTDDALGTAVECPHDSAQTIFDSFLHLWRVVGSTIVQWYSSIMNNARLFANSPRPSSFRLISS